MSMCRWQVRLCICEEQALMLFVVFFLLEQQVKIQLLIQEAHWEAKDKSTLIFTLGRKGPTKLFKNLEGKEAKEMLLLIH